MSEIILNQQQRNHLLDILQQRLQPSELQELIFRILGPNEVHNLSGHAFIEKIMAFLVRVEQLEKHGELLTHLAATRPDIDFSSFGIESSPEVAPSEPAPTTFINFVNRKDEWERVVLYHEAKGQYYLFDAPAGYGKTALLHKIEHEFEQRNWRCLTLCLSKEGNTFQAVVNEINEKFQISLSQFSDKPYHAGQILGEEIATQRERVSFDGLAMLIDVDHDPFDQAIETLAILIEQFIPGVHDGLLKHSDHFSHTQWSLRVVVTGRYLHSRIQQFKTSISFDVTRLTPFSYAVAYDVCQLYDITQEQERRDFAAHLLFYSGGHPRCMVRILERFKESGCASTHFFDTHQQEIEVLASEESNWVRHSISKDWRLVFDTLCWYRRFDRHVLEQLLMVSRHWKYLAEDGFDLGLKLKQSYLVNWADENRRHLRDDITRRLLMIQRYHDVSDEIFQNECEEVQQTFLARLETADYDRANWVVESLLTHLQGHISKIRDAAGRAELRQTFLETKLREALAILIRNRDPRDEKESLLGILEHDWEFQFTLNYYLRDMVYDDSPYQQMLTHIEHFFSNLSLASGGQ